MAETSNSVIVEDQLPAMTEQQSKLTSASGFSLYRELAVGQGSLLALAYYEFCLLCFGGLPGICGYGSRALFFKNLFRHCGPAPRFGKGLVLRNLKQVTLGKKVLIDDFAGIDVRGNDGEIHLGDYVSIGRYSTIAAKSARISLGDGVNVGSYCRIASQSRVEIGASTLIAAYAYIGPGNHQSGDESVPLIAQPMEIKGGVTIGKNVWIGTKATILDGVTIGDRAIIGAHSLVMNDVPAGAVAVGSPAKILSR